MCHDNSKRCVHLCVHMTNVRFIFIISFICIGNKCRYIESTLNTFVENRKCHQRQNNFVSGVLFLYKKKIKKKRTKNTRRKWRQRKRSMTDIHKMIFFLGDDDSTKNDVADALSMLYTINNQFLKRGKRAARFLCKWNNSFCGWTRFTPRLLS